MKVAIVGYTPHRIQAPWGQPDWELWLLNDLYMQQLGPLDPKRVRWFELHPWNEIGPDGKPATYSVDRAHTQVLRKLASEGAKVYLQEPRPEEFPEAAGFPYMEMYEFFKGKLGSDRKYFSNTISFEIALAIMEMSKTPGPHELGIWGVDMMTGGGGGVNNEYSWQRPSCEYWIAAAEFSGIKCHLPVESDILSLAFVYGDYAGNRFRTKLEYEMRNTLQNLQGFKNQAAQLNAQAQQLEGRKATLEWELNTWMPGDNGLGDGRASMPGGNKVDLTFARFPNGQVQISPTSDMGMPVNRLAPVLTPSDGPKLVP